MKHKEIKLREKISMWVLLPTLSPTVGLKKNLKKEHMSNQRDSSPWWIMVKAENLERKQQMETHSAVLCADPLTTVI